jgi:restriction system protein
VYEFRIHHFPAVVPITEAGIIAATLLAQSRERNPLLTLDREIASSSEIVSTATESSAGELESVRIRLLQIAPLEFEVFIKKVMERSGFIDVSVTKASGDGGIDVNAYVDATNDFFAGTHVQAQVKRWRHAVGSPDINSFRGALNTTAKGVFVTTSAFTQAAITEARHTNKPSISLIDGSRLSSIVLRLHLTLS